MKPEPTAVVAGVPAGHRAFALVEPGKAWAVYVARDVKDKEAPVGSQTVALQLRLPVGRYRAEWVNPRTGRVDLRSMVESPGGVVTVASPAFEEDVALRLRRR
jgi:hypothetical protein